MRNRFLTRLIAIAPLALCNLVMPCLNEVQAGPQTKIACLGDSITFGALLEDRQHHAYPAQLAQRLGPGYEVRNFGVSSTTLLRKADRPLSGSAAFQTALEWKPTIAVVVLGTNDSVQNRQRANWQHSDELERDAKALLQELAEAGEVERVLLCSPPPMYPNSPGLSEERRQDLELRAPRLKQVAKSLKSVALESSDDLQVEFVDLTRALSPGQVVDGVHPNPFGAESLADHLWQVITADRSQPLDLGQQLSEQQASFQRSDFHGFARFDFPLPSNSTNCILVAPHTAAAGRPWIWRARFFGHEPALDLDLLDHGFHMGYVDISHLYGSPQAMQRMQSFQSFCSELGLSKRPALEGMSRGGLAALNYAIRFPNQVSAIYLDNPVCDLRTWPGGRGGQRSDDDWKRCKQAYGLSESEAWSHTGPLGTNLEEQPPLLALSQAQVPMFVVLGNNDQVVPPDLNGERIAQQASELNLPIDVWRKPGAGHHPHGLHPPQPLARAIRRACGQAVMPTVHARPSAEHRGSAAGWGGGNWWQAAAHLREQATMNQTVDIAFLGDSITQSLSGSQERWATPGGSRAFDQVFASRTAISLGLSGDRTEHLLYRIQHGALQHLQAKLIVLQIGINNLLTAKHTASEVAAGIEAVVKQLRTAQPKAHIVLCGPFPTGSTPQDSKRQSVSRIHELIESLAQTESPGPRVHYLDLRPLFLDANGVPNQRMASDTVHITAEGQAAWLEALQPVLEELLAN